MEDQALIYAYHLSGPKKAQALSWDEVKENRFDNKGVWLHFNYTHPDTRAWLEKNPELDELAVKSLLNEATRPHTTRHQNCTVLTLRGINLNPGSDPEDMVSIRIWATSKTIITARNRRLLSTQDIVQQIERGDGPETPGQFISNLAERLIARMQSVIGDMEEKVEEIEELSLEHDPRALRSQIADIRRQAVSLRRYLKPQKEAMERLLEDDIELFSHDDKKKLADTINHLTRYLEELEAMRDRAAITQEELAGAVNEQLNSRMYVLSIVAALFLPLGFLTGLLGINVGGIPGAEYDNAFLAFCLLLSGLVAAQVLIFRVKKWF